MKVPLVGLILCLLSGCAMMAPKDYSQYVDTAKSLSKDNTMAQTACWSAVAEIAKSGDNSAKVGAIALAEKCKNEPIKIEAPKKGWLGF
jgi:hypothetical protein